VLGDLTRQRNFILLFFLYERSRPTIELVPSSHDQHSVTVISHSVGLITS